MTTIFAPIREFLKKGDLLLLFLCLLASGYGLVLIYSATRAHASGSLRFVAVQAVAVCIGVGAYFLLTLVDFQLFTARSWKLLVLFDIGFILLLRTPLGTDHGSGNLNWLSIPGFPLDIQPNEVVKIPFILLLAYQIDRIQKDERDISALSSLLQVGGHTLFMVGLIAAICGDMGTCVVYMCIFVMLLWSAGVRLRWFAGVGGLGLFAAAVIWIFFLPDTKWWEDYRIMRFRVVFDHTLSPERYGFQQTRSIQAIGAGQLTGVGYMQGTQSQTLPVRQSDFIFSVCGEELGMVGCVLLLAILAAIILRCVWVGRHASSPFAAYTAMGVSGMLLAQVVFNVGMCLFVLPVMGLTLPFISHGGSSVITLYAAMGIVSSIKAHTLPSWLRDRSQV